jgi:hypothetical protein
MTLSDRVEEINEQRIGVDVFGRAPNYDPGTDGIVRSHATRLRQRLDSYFSGEGIHEPLRIEIPRGGYVPRFYPAGKEAASEGQSPAEKPADISVPQAFVQQASALEPVPDKQPRLRWLKPFLAGLLLAGVVVVIALHLRRDAALAAGHSEITQSAIERRFWSSLFPANGRTLIVPGDSGLVLYETVTGQEVTLADYVGGVYRDPGRVKSLPSGVSQELAQSLASRRYTSIVDLNIATQLSHLPQWNPEHSATVFARDLRPSEADSSNLILIGSKEADPWVSLIEPSMNFVLAADKKWGFAFINRHPQNGEQAEYTPQEASGGIGAPAVYGDVAYLPNPNGKGMVLVLGGLWMSGTQSAENFVLDGTRFSDWLQSIANPDGTIPSFEVLISTRSLESSATDSSIIAKRVHIR